MQVLSGTAVEKWKPLLTTNTRQIGSFAVQSIGLDFSSAATLIIIINGMPTPSVS